MEESETSETSEASEKSAPKLRRDRINRALKRARKAAGPDYDENPAQVQFMIEEARILATLEIADALRDNQGEAEEA